MDFSSKVIKFCILIVVSEYGEAQERFDEYLASNMDHIKDIPREFVISGNEANIEFKKYANEIQSLTAGRNLTAEYNVKVELHKSVPKTSKKKRLYKKIKSKKYNVPLKKQNMKLSTFELLLRKLAEENGQKSQNYDLVSEFTTVKFNKDVSYKPIKLKFKPIVSRIKTNYTKIIRPVRSKFITL